MATPVAPSSPVKARRAQPPPLTGSTPTASPQSYLNVPGAQPLNLKAPGEAAPAKKKKKKKAAAPMPASTATATEEGAAAQDWTRIAPAVDVFAIMTYDHGGRNAPPQPIGPTPWTLDVLEYAASITDLSKVRMGLHFYGYTWPRGNPPATTLNWEGVQRYIDSFKPEIQRDPANMEAFIDFKPVGLPRQVVYFADATSVAFKVEQALAAFPELGGVAIWGLGGEDPANWDVLRDLRPAACGTDEE